MGGLVIVLASVLAYFIATLRHRQHPSASVLLLMFLFVGLGTVGFLDDYIKISRSAVSACAAARSSSGRPSSPSSSAG
jgi:UDP-N-acetylmuramyl pentapeptide phosphotransferase/UDP-N-acetylglucosamine-1-phosphate transferase